MLTVNTEPPYPHFFHQVTVADITALQLSGDADISYVGFGPSDLTPAPRVGFNLTFICPEGQVFDHDWFATPFIMMTCQVKSRDLSRDNMKSFLLQENGVFDEPDWESFQCVWRKLKDILIREKMSIFYLHV